MNIRRWLAGVLIDTALKIYPEIVYDYGYGECEDCDRTPDESWRCR